jgi:hypothetical protein
MVSLFSKAAKYLFGYIRRRTRRDGGDQAWALKHSVFVEVDIDENRIGAVKRPAAIET